MMDTGFLVDLFAMMSGIAIAALVFGAWGLLLGDGNEER